MAAQILAEHNMDGGKTTLFSSIKATKMAMQNFNLDDGQVI